MSGHSKWSNIKRQKEAADAKKGKIFTRLGRDITVAARNGGTDPESNAALRLAIQKARDNNMPADNIERAIKKATSATDASALVETAVEGYSPGGAAILVQILTDNRNRTLSEVRNLFSRHNANVGESGCVTWIFEHKGLIHIEASSDTEELALVAIDAGAEDVKVDGGSVEVYTNPADLEYVRKSLEANGLKVSSGELTMVPQNLVTLNEKDGIQTLKLLEKLEDTEGVQHVFTNADFPDEVLESYRSGKEAAQLS
ncbi:MAG: YebC/PmpR family DNA-binding transcriptional regulator [Chloroflexota bacterium]